MKESRGLPEYWQFNRTLQSYVKMLSRSFTITHRYFLNASRRCALCSQRK